MPSLPHKLTQHLHLHLHQSSPGTGSLIVILMELYSTMRAVEQQWSRPSITSAIMAAHFKMYRSYFDATRLTSSTCTDTNLLLQTYFKPYSQSPAPAHQCTNLDMLHSAVWEITNLNENQGFTLKPDDCAKWLTEIYDQCGRGGDLIVSGWKYR